MHTNRIPWSVLAFAGAALTRETNALPIAGIGCYYAWKALGEKQVFMGRRYFWFLIPAGVVLAWHAYLRIQYGAWPVFGLVTTKPPWSPIPFQGLISFFFQGFPFEGLTLSKGMGGFSLPATQSLYDVYRCFQLALCLFVTMLGILALRSSRVPGFLVIAWFFTGFVFYGLMDWVWAMGPSSFLRVGAECATIGLLIIAVSKPVIRWLAFFVVGAAWASAFALYLLW